MTHTQRRLESCTLERRELEGLVARGRFVHVITESDVLARMMRAGPDQTFVQSQAHRFRDTHGASHSPRTRSTCCVDFSRTSVETPARARAFASAPPPIPPPTTTTSAVSGTSGRSRGKSHWQPARSGYEVGRQPLGNAGRSDVRQPGENFAEHHLDFNPRKVCAQAEVRPAPTERDVFVGRACDVEPI